MAVAGESTALPVPAGLVGFAQTPGGRNFFLMLGVAAILAVMSGVWMWSQQPDYRVLFSNFSDRDGGAIVASLQQMNVPYKFADGGGAILVPAGQVHEARLKLASQGLPKGGNVGFELMENQKLGVSQFLEQVNFQRALEGELARSIQSLAAVQAARVHLALPKASVFVRDQQKPTASVLLNLQSGRTLDPQQVSAIVHLVASSVPDLPAKNVTVVDQSGNLLSEAGKQNNAIGLDPSQLKYVQELQQNIVRRIESIVTPIVGPDNVHAEATADVDFSHTEQAAETYAPNQSPPLNAPAAATPATGTAANAATKAGAAQTQPPVPVNSHKDMTVNYELDKTVKYVQQPMGGLKRLSVAVVVNYRKVVGKDGKVSMKPLSDAEKTQITELVKEAMGYNKERGDSLEVVNSAFAGAEKEIIPETPVWKRPDVLRTAMGFGKYAIGGAILAYLFFGVLRPLLRRIGKTFEPQQPTEDAVVHLSHDVEPMGTKPRTYQDNLDAAKQLAKNDPKMVANVVKAWVGTNE